MLPALAAIGHLRRLARTACSPLALNEGLVSLVSVLASLYPVVTLALACSLLGERVASPRRAGVAVALAGVALIAAG